MDSPPIFERYPMSEFSEAVLCPRLAAVVTGVLKEVWCGVSALEDSELVGEPKLVTKPGSECLLSAGLTDPIGSPISELAFDVTPVDGRYFCVTWGWRLC
ncbi:unnamed protein product [Schistosoma mattheei]|uniref:Uncharacterized protein n=1 Tax=Schistosoma mattheei TaxID=31246 RepID=A0A3P8FDD7_9TREM|nr:unnamed protein product [Schistosoma mattheei]